MIFIIFLIAFLIALGAGMGITTVITLALDGWQFWVAIGAYITFLFLAFIGSLMVGARIGILVTVLLLFGALLPFLLGWAP